MAIINNEDIKLMANIESLLHEKLVQTNAIKDNDYTQGYYFDENDKEYDLWCQYWKLVERFINDKKQQASKQNQWNKENKVYHRITNNITYHKARGNKEQLEYWRNKLKEYKEQHKEAR